MKIWHDGASASPDEVNGVNYAIWKTAQAQVALGHDVSLLVSDEVNKSAIRRAVSLGIKLLHAPQTKFSYQRAAIKHLLETVSPDIVHFHSVFIPRQAALAKRLRKAKIPYVVTPHGGTSPFVLFRNLLKKSLYKWLIEAPRFRGAAAITAVLPKEINEIRAFANGYQGAIYFVPNPIDESLFDEQPNPVKCVRKQIVYLGRFDVFHKGLDVLAKIARHLPEADFHLYGSEAAKDSAQIAQLEKICPANVRFHPPVFGAEKIRVLTDADLYIQTSRWEAFGISIAEAMALGLPCAIAESLNFAELFAREKLGVILPANPKEAATAIADVLDNPDALADYIARAKKFALENFTAQTVAVKYLDCYRDVLAQSAVREKADSSFSGGRENLGINFERQSPAARQNKI